MKHDLIIIRYGEIALKSRYIREQFENKLIKNITNALKNQNIKSIIKKDFEDGLGILKKVDEPTIIVMPDAVSLTGSDLYMVQQKKPETMR